MLCVSLSPGRIRDREFSGDRLRSLSLKPCRTLSDKGLAMHPSGHAGVVISGRITSTEDSPLHG